MIKKTQPQKLLEELLPDPPLETLSEAIRNEDEKFPTETLPPLSNEKGQPNWATIEEQAAYWERKELEALDQVHIPTIKFCVNCGSDVSNWKYCP